MPHAPHDAAARRRRPLLRRPEARRFPPAPRVRWRCAAPPRERRSRGDLAMNLSELFIRRPVLTVLLNAAIVVAGVIAWGKIPVAALPSYNTPVINVSAQLP